MPPETMTVAEQRRPPVPGDGPASGLIAALANAVRALHHQQRRGDLANLRRMDPGMPVTPAFQQILVRAAPDADLDRARRIGLFVKILCLPMSVDGLGEGRRPLGEALAADGVSEARVQMMMTARNAALDDLLLRTARRLARTGSLPFEEFGRLILGDAETVDRTRFDVAKSYWGHHARRENETSSSATDTFAGAHS